MSTTNSEDVQDTGTSTRSKKSCRLLCDPLKVPKVPYSKPKVLKIREMSRDCAMQVSDYFQKRHERRKAAYFQLRGAKRK